MRTVLVMPETAASWLNFVSAHLFGFAQFDPIMLNLAAVSAHSGYRNFQLQYQQLDLPEEEMNGMREMAYLMTARANVFQDIPVVEHLVEWTSGRKISKTLDMASGFGLMPAYLRSKGHIKGQLILLDRSSMILEQAKTMMASCNTKATFHQGLLEAIPFTEIYRDYFDLITCFNGIYCTKQWRKTLVDARDMCAPNGLLAMSQKLVSCREYDAMGYVQDIGFDVIDGIVINDDQLIFLAQKTC